MTKENFVTIYLFVKILCMLQQIKIKTLVIHKNVYVIEKLMNIYKS